MVGDWIRVPGGGLAAQGGGVGDDHLGAAERMQATGPRVSRSRLREPACGAVALLASFRPIRHSAAALRCRVK
uniref:Uncharacterized protein n=1 Tax=Arundo donax TaxID=35708 RepID=A0A0A8Y9Z6_ARUDO